MVLVAPPVDVPPVEVEFELVAPLVSPLVEPSGPGLVFASLHATLTARHAGKYKA